MPAATSEPPVVRGLIEVLPLQSPPFRLLWRLANTPSTCALACLLVPFLLAGCARTPSPSGVAGTPLPVWPAPPEIARVAYVQSILKPADLGIKSSAFARFGRWITGSDTGNEALIKPFGIAFDEADNLCLTDTGAAAVCFYDRARQKWHRWEKVGRIRLSSPVAVAKQNGVFFVADSALGAVFTFAEDGKPGVRLTNHLERPAGLVILNHELFVADSQRQRIVVFGLDGTFRREFGQRGREPGQFNFPTHLATDPQGHLLVTDSMNSRIQVLDPQGRAQGEIGKLGDSPGHFGRPKGVGVDSFGHVYAMDAVFDNIQVFDQQGRLLLNFGETGSRPGEFWLPNGIAISRQNEIFVTDSYNRRVQVFKYIGPS